MNFTYSGFTFTYLDTANNKGLWYDQAEAKLAVAGFGTQCRPADVSLVPNVDLTVELIIGNDSSGQRIIDRHQDSYRVWYSIDTLGITGNYITVPGNNDQDVTVQIIVRMDGNVVATSSVVIPPPLNLSVTSISPTPATGKVCTVTLNKSVPNNSWHLNQMYANAYHNDPAWRAVCDAYKTDMATEVTANDYGFSQFTFYIPYYTGSDYARTDDDGKVSWKFFVVCSTDYFQTNTIINVEYHYYFTMLYVDQSDPLASPTVVLNAIAENPSGMLATYGKYVGGNIGKLTFSLASVSCKFGSSFRKRTMSLYYSDGTFVKSWEYSNTNSFTLTLSNTVDKAWYMVVSITDSAGRVGSATTATFQAYGYEPPSIISLNASRCNQDGTPNDSGAYCKITYQFKVNALGNHNSKDVTLNAPDSSHEYTNLDYDHGSAYQYICAANTETSYQIDLIVEDDFNTITQTMNLSTAGVIMDFLYNGKGIGLGKVAETTDMVEVNPQWTFKAQTIQIRGQDLATILQSLGYTFPT